MGLTAEPSSLRTLVCSLFQIDVNHDILKTRISDKGVPVAAPGKRGALQKDQTLLASRDTRSHTYTAHTRRRTPGRA